MTDLHINPELFAIVPESSKEDFTALKKSIEIHRQQLAKERQKIYSSKKRTSQEDRD